MKLVGGPARRRPRSRAEDVVRFDPAALAAHLSVQIASTGDRDGRHFVATVRTKLLGEKPDPEPWNFDENTRDLVTNLMEEFTRPKASLFERQAALNGAGLDLWERAPESFKDLFWKIVDDPSVEDPATIYVSTAEPNIPWELMRPWRYVHNRREERRALGVDYAVGRWIHSKYLSPVQQVSLDNSCVVAPTYRTKPLEKAEEEAQFVCDHFAGTRLDPAIQTALDTYLKTHPVGLLHFVAHGKSGKNAAQTLRLEGHAVLSGTQIGGLTGLKAGFEKKPPLVFLNACEVGRPTPSLVGVGGLAADFINAGARGVIAPLWSVRSSLAHDVAVAFYQQALANPTTSFAKILSGIRSKSYAPFTDDNSNLDGDDPNAGEDTYAAYCYYGDPRSSLHP